MSTNLYAYDFEVDGIYYNILSSQNLTLEVTYGPDDGTSYSGSIVIPETLDYKNRLFSITGIGLYAFKNCNVLEKVEIPNKVNTIKDEAFSGCSCLKEINIPNSVVAIGKGAFDGCSSLTKMILPENLTTISTSMFRDCNSLKEITISSKVTRIDDYAFYKCSSLASIVIPGSVNNVGYDVFNGCTNLEKVVFEWGENTLNFRRNTIVRDINPNPNGYRMEYHYGYFHDCPIREVVFDRVISFHTATIEAYSSTQQKSVESDGPFSNIPTFTKLTIGDNVTFIAAMGFSNCKNIKEIPIGKNVKIIGSSAFAGCTGVEKIVIPNNVETIRSYAFANSSNLKEIRFGEKLSSVDYNALEGLTNLETIFSYAQKPPSVSESQGLDNMVYTFADVYVPIGTKEQYEKTIFWKKFASIKEFDSTGFISVTSDLNNNQKIFDLNGRIIENSKHGLNIIKMSNGRTKKVIIK